MNASYSHHANRRARAPKPFLWTLREDQLLRAQASVKGLPPSYLFWDLAGGPGPWSAPLGTGALVTPAGILLQSSV